MIDPQSSRTIGYHLFLEPTGAVAEELSSIIHTLSAEYGGPVFSPHVTLLARIPEGNEEEVIEKSRSLARSLSPLTLTLGELDMRDEYFKALYIQIQERELVEQYHGQANTTFALQDESEYVPHLSLLYGNYSESAKAETRKALVYPKGTSFQTDRMHLYRTGGEASEWVRLQEFTLGN